MPSTPAEAFAFSARAQAHRDAEVMRLKQQIASALRRADAAEADKLRITQDRAALQRDLSLKQATEVPGYIKEVVLKFLLAGESGEESILPVLVSVLQFSRAEREQVRTARASVLASIAPSLGTLFAFPPDRPATELVQPLVSAPNSSSASEVRDMREKIAKLKRLLDVANTHLTRLREERRLADEAAQP